MRKHNWDDIGTAIDNIRNMLSTRDKIPVKYDKARPLIEEMTKDILVQVETINKMMNEIVINGVEDDIPF